MCNHRLDNQVYLTITAYKDKPKTRQWMKLYDMSLEHSRLIEIAKYRKHGKRLLKHTIDLYKSGVGFQIRKYSISEVSKVIKMDTHTFTLSYNTHTLASALSILNILTQEYTRYGSHTGNTVSVIIKNQLSLKVERYNT